jgi:hypothetical protein
MDQFKIPPFHPEIYLDDILQERNAFWVVWQSPCFTAGTESASHSHQSHKYPIPHRSYNTHINSMEGRSKDLVSIVIDIDFKETTRRVGTFIGGGKSKPVVRLQGKMQILQAHATQSSFGPPMVLMKIDRV